MEFSSQCNCFTSCGKFIIQGDDTLIVCTFVYVEKIQILCDVAVCHWATFLGIVISSSGASFPRKIFRNTGTTHLVTQCHITEEFIFITTARTSNLACFE